jgi:hypothetical protein
VICDPLVLQPGQVLHDVLVSLRSPLTIADYYKRIDESHKQNPQIDDIAAAGFKQAWG